MDSNVSNDENTAVISSPDEGELRDLDNKADETLDETEAQLRKKLLKKQQQKNTTRSRRFFDEEEMFAMQPGHQDTKKKEIYQKLERRRTRDDEERERQLARERERAIRKPIRWEVLCDSKDREKDRSVSAKRYSGSKNERLSDRISPSSSSSHHKNSPSRRKPEDHKDPDTRSGKSIKREPDSLRERHHHRHRHEKHHRHDKDRRSPEHSRRLPEEASSVSRHSTTRDTSSKNYNDSMISASSKRDVVDVPKRSKTGDSIITKRPIINDEMTSPPSKRIATEDVRPPSKSPKAEQISGSSDEDAGIVTPVELVTLVTAEAAVAESSIEVCSKEESPERRSVTPQQQSNASTPRDTSAEVGETILLDSDGFDHDMDDESQEMEQEKPALSTYQKSRFESSPEIDDGEVSDFDDDLSENDFDAHEPDEPVQAADLNESVFELEQKDFDDLTEEDKAKLSPDRLERMEKAYQSKLISMLPIYYPGIEGCRNVGEFECVNRIEEGTFGVVYRAVERKTDEVVALKRLKMENELNGFPITSLREINMLLKCGGHPNIVNLREIVVGSSMDKIYLVMEFVDHDMKALMETMSKKDKRFTMGQIKTLMQQLLNGVGHLHREYVIHRDLKTSNLLLTRNGILKIGDFGLAREFGDPLKCYTAVVVTLWYRSPELLLGVKEYSTAVDMWSVGCIFGEFLQFKPLFPGRYEIDQLNKIFKEIGTPNEKIWPGYNQLPGVVKFAFVDTPYNQLRKKIEKGRNEVLTDEGFELLNRLLAPCPNRRHSAATALASDWFKEDPQPVDPSLFPTWPSKSDAFSKDKSKINAPAPAKLPPGLNAAQLKLMEDLKVDAKHVSGDGFSLKFDIAKF